MELTTLLVAGLVFLIVFFFYRRHDPNLPPCPATPIPFLGHVFHVAGDSRPVLKKWRKQCGDIFSLYIAGKVVIVLNGFDLIKDALVKKADVFSDRPPYFVNKAVEMEGAGVIFSSGPNWKEQRSVSLSILRAFGMGKNVLAQRIEEEVGFFIQYLSSLKGKATDLRPISNVSTSNIICSILVGHRFEYDDKNFQDLMHKLCSLVGDYGNFSVINYIMWLRFLPGDYFNAKKLGVSINGVMKALKKIIDDQRRHEVDSNEVVNLIDAYTVERNKKIKSGVSTFLDDENLLKILMDLFQAGTETSSTTFYWTILYILHHPEIQEKMYQEIKDKVGTERSLTMQDKSKLTYVNAVIAETQRLASIVPSSVSHICSEEVTLNGYTIPKGAYIIPNLDSVLYEKDTWGADAMSFRPERFIDNGKLKIPEQFIPFGIGRRVCLGEAIAQMELFLYVGSMFQRFEFLPPTPGCIPPIKYVDSIVIAPLPFEVRAVERK